MNYIILFMFNLRNNTVYCTSHHISTVTTNDDCLSPDWVMPVSKWNILELPYAYSIGMEVVQL